MRQILIRLIPSRLPWSERLGGVGLNNLLKDLAFCLKIGCIAHATTISRNVNRRQAHD